MMAPSEDRKSKLEKRKWRKRWGWSLRSAGFQPAVLIVVTVHEIRRQDGGATKTGDR
jgi:hypothetical protein